MNIYNNIAWPDPKPFYQGQVLAGGFLRDGSNTYSCLTPSHQANQARIEKGIDMKTTMRKSQWLCWILVGISAVLSPVISQAASFDCDKATTKVEKMVCSDLKLSKLDDKLNILYREALKKFSGLDTIKQVQRAWLKTRNDCISAPRPNICIKTKYKGRIAELNPYDVNYKLPVTIKDLGENWQYNRDADKLSVIAKIMARGELKDPPPAYNTDHLCKTFPEDLIAGRNIEVIEPDIEIINRDDPRLGERRYTDLDEKGVLVLPRNDPKVGGWFKCDGIDSGESSASHPKNIFTWFDLQGLLPYRIYHTELDGNPENGLEDVLLFREQGNGYSHDYLWVDLKGCEIKQKIQVNSPAHRLRHGYKDVLSLLIRYRGEVMVLQYSDQAKEAAPDKQEKVTINYLNNPSNGCMWGDPYNLLWGQYKRSSSKLIK